MIRPALLALVLALAPLPALAHKVLMGVFPSGSRIEGEIGFSSGGAPSGQRVDVFDAEGNRLGETFTDEDGFFLFTPTEPVGHVFRADLGAGHVAEAEMATEDVATIVERADSGAATIRWSGTGPAAPAAAGPVASTRAATIADGATQTPAPALDPLELDAIASAMRDEIRPLRRELAAYRERNDLQSVLGGIGYIIGLFGVGFYVAAHRKLKAVA